MDINNEIFKRRVVNFDKLTDYGFKKEDKFYKYSRNILNDNFRVDIFINLDTTITSRVYDLLMDEEYINININSNNSEFVNKVRNEYKNFLFDISEKCFDKKYFIFAQSNRIANYIKDKYNDDPEFLWEGEDYGVFRNKSSNKWYGIIMNIDKSKIDNQSGEIEILDIKISEEILEKYLSKKGFYKAYHMNKKKWITIILDDTVMDKDIYDLIDKSYQLVDKK